MKIALMLLIACISLSMGIIIENYEQIPYCKGTGDAQECGTNSRFILNIPLVHNGTAKWRMRTSDGDFDVNVRIVEPFLQVMAEHVGTYDDYVLDTVEFGSCGGGGSHPVVNHDYCSMYLATAPVDSCCTRSVRYDIPGCFLSNGDFYHATHATPLLSNKFEIFEVHHHAPQLAGRFEIDYDGKAHLFGLADSEPTSHDEKFKIDVLSEAHEVDFVDTAVMVRDETGEFWLHDKTLFCKYNPVSDGCYGIKAEGLGQCVDLNRYVRYSAINLLFDAYQKIIHYPHNTALFADEGKRVREIMPEWSFVTRTCPNCTLSGMFTIFEAGNHRVRIAIDIEGALLYEYDEGAVFSLEDIECVLSTTEFIGTCRVEYSCEGYGFGLLYVEGQQKYHISCSDSKTEIRFSADSSSAFDVCIDSSSYDRDCLSVKARLVGNQTDFDEVDDVIDEAGDLLDSFWNSSFGKPVTFSIVGIVGFVIILVVVFIVYKRLTRTSISVTIDQPESDHNIPGEAYPLLHRRGELASGPPEMEYV